MYLLATWSTAIISKPDVVIINKLKSPFNYVTWLFTMYGQIFKTVTINYIFYVGCHLVIFFFSCTLLLLGWRKFMCFCIAADKRLSCLVYGLSRNDTITHIFLFFILFFCLFLTISSYLVTYIDILTFN